MAKLIGWDNCKVIPTPIYFKMHQNIKKYYFKKNNAAFPLF